MSSAVIHPRIQAASGTIVPQVLGFFFAWRICITLLAFQSEPTAGTAVYNGGSVLLVFFAWLAAPADSAFKGLKGTAKWVFAYLLMIGISVLWSVTTSPGAALGYWVGLVSECIAVYFIMKGEDVVDTSHSIMRGFVVGAVVVGVIAWCLPTMPDLRIGDEDFLHPNALGYVLGIATLFALHLARQSRMMAFLAVFCGGTVVRSLSKASIAALIAAGVFYVLRDSHLSRKSKITIGIIAAVLIAASWGLLEAYADIYSTDYHVETLTGRTYLWDIAWEESLKTPWVGHGFYSFRSVIPVIGDFQPWHAHNELLQQFFSYGIVGTIVFLCMYAGFIRTIRRNRRSSFATIAASVMVLSVVRGIVDTENVTVNYPLWLLIMFAGVLPNSLPDSR